MTKAYTSCDVCIIGAGIAGAFVARELSRFDLKSVVLEAGNDIACGATRANSAIVHAGFDPKPNTNKARFNVAGAKMYPALAQELSFSYQNNGSLVVAFSEEDLEIINSLAQRAQENHVEVRVLNQEELRSLEPNVSADACGALLAPTAGICDPYGACLAAAENAAENGVAFSFNSRVEKIEPLSDLSKTDLSEGFLPNAASEDDDVHCTPKWLITCEDESQYVSAFVVNAAGVHSDELHNQVSATKLSITPRRGEYCLYDTTLGTTFKHTMFQAPSKNGKGVLITPTVHGNLLVGPNAVPQDHKDSLNTSISGLRTIIHAAQKTWPGLGTRDMITNFAGVRSTGNTGDFEIGEPSDAPGFYDIACFESPGLTSAPAVALHIAQEIAQAAKAAPNKRFNPIRKRDHRFIHLPNKLRAQKVAQDANYGRVVCRCNGTTEAEIIEALHGPLPVLCLDAIKWRTGAMMGRCHGGFCSPEIARIMARELGISPDKIDKRTPDSSIVATARPDYLDLVASANASHSGEAPVPEANQISSIKDSGKDDEGKSRATSGASLSASSEGSSCDSDIVSAVPAQAKRSFDFLQLPNTPVEPNPEGSAVKDCYDVVVVGGGAAGIAAANAAAAQGSSVLLIDREAKLGGILKQCVHNGFGLHRFKEELTGPEYAKKELQDLSFWNNPARALDASTQGGYVDICHDSAVLRIYPNNKFHHDQWVIFTNKTGLYSVSALSVVLATGSRERSIGALNVAGSRPAGVFSAGSAQNFMNLQGCLPGKRVVILGSGDIGLIMARRMVSQGAEVLGVYELMPEPSGLRRNIVQCLDDFNIPLHLSKTVVRLEGEGRLEAVHVASVDPKGMVPVPGSEERIECDTLLLSVGLLPENELAHRALLELSPVTGGAVVDQNLETSASGIFACGNALHIHDLVDHASDEGEIAGRAAALHAKRNFASVSGETPAVKAEVLAAVHTSNTAATTKPHKTQTCMSKAGTTCSGELSDVSGASLKDIVTPLPSVANGALSLEVTPGDNLRYCVPQKITVIPQLREELASAIPGAQVSQEAQDVVKFSFRVTRRLEKPRFFIQGGMNGSDKLETIKSSKALIAVPAEMLQIKVKLADLAPYDYICLSARGEEE